VEDVKNIWLVGVLSVEAAKLLNQLGAAQWTGVQGRIQLSTKPRNNPKHEKLIEAVRSVDKRNIELLRERDVLEREVQRLTRKLGKKP
jgi:hypothetical protein